MARETVKRKSAKNGHEGGEGEAAQQELAEMVEQAIFVTGAPSVGDETARPVADDEIGVEVALLKRLSETPGIPGREEQVRALMRAELEPLVDELTVDALGNLIARKAGKGKSKRTILLDAHMDEIGFLVRHVDERGFVRLQNVGTFDPRVLVAQRVRVQTRDGASLPGAFVPALKPSYFVTDGAIPAAKLDDLYVDLGLPADRVRRLISIGDPVTLDRQLERLGETVMAKAMDDRAGLFTMIETLRRLGKHDADVVAVASVQEEVGLRGAGPAAFAVKPDVAIALDVTSANDTPGYAEADAVTRLGEGVAIKVFDGASIPNYKLVRHMRELAEANGIRHQLEILPRGGTNAGAIERARAGAATIALSIPCRYLHTVDEMVNLLDIEAAATLLARYLEGAHEGDYTL